MAEEVVIPTAKAVPAIGIIVAILILVGSVFALMAGNNLRTLAETEAEKVKYKSAKYDYELTAEEGYD